LGVWAIRGAPAQSASRMREDFFMFLLRKQ
jgi:hypothetical protein